MTKEQIDESLRAVFGYVAAKVKEEGYCDVNIALKMADTFLRDVIKIDSPESKELLAPGTVVWFEKCLGCGWEIGIVAINVVCGANGTYKIDQVARWKPAHILAPDEAKVKIPPVIEWPPRSEGIMGMFYGYGAHQSYRRIITRAEAERMEKDA